jgi:uncharacterized membrane protein YdfJ with MMPL/SSD domain
VPPQDGLRSVRSRHCGRSPVNVEQCRHRGIGRTGDTGDTGQAVAHGIKISAGVVTAAAVIMVFVFLTFATMSMVQLKETGVGLAVGVLLDATVVRALLLPATMKLLGRRNWYLPR